MSSPHFTKVDLVVAFELFQTFGTGEGFIHAEAEDDMVGGPLGEEVLEVVDVAFGTQAVADFVAGPSKTAELEFFVWMCQLDEGFEGAGFLKAFDKGVAVEEDAVAFLEVDLGEGGEWEEGGEEERGEEEGGEEGFHWKLEGSVGFVGSD